MNGLWLVQWTGQGAIVGQADSVLYFRADGQAPPRLTVVTGWQIYNGVLQSLDVRQFDTPRQRAMRQAAAHRLANVGVLTGASIRDFPPTPVFYDPYLVREFWLGSPTGLRALLLAKVREYDEG